MRKNLILATLLVTILALTSLASAQPPRPGEYQMDWAILHNPVSSDMPTLEADTRPITLENAAGTGLCPPTSAVVVRDAPASSIMGNTSGVAKGAHTLDRALHTSLAWSSQ